MKTKVVCISLTSGGSGVEIGVWRSDDHVRYYNSRDCSRATLDRLQTLVTNCPDAQLILGWLHIHLEYNFNSDWNN